jgi:hypothetical protein
MPMWRCPHCGTPQAETARCWVCRRSSTACATCRHFRRSVAAQLGYCGLDRQRRPLNGDEIRACWEAAAGPAGPSEPGRSRPRPASVDLDLERTPVRRLEFVEVGAAVEEEPEHRLRRRTSEPATRRARAPGPAPAFSAIASSRSVANPSETSGLQHGSAEPRWSLWSDGEI